MIRDLSAAAGQSRVERDNPLLDELHFSLLDSDIEEFYAALSRCKDIYAKRHVSYADELEDALYELDWLISWFDRQCQTAALLRMYDTADEQARQDELYARRVYTQLNTAHWDALNDMKVAVTSISTRENEGEMPPTIGIQCSGVEHFRNITGNLQRIKNVREVTRGSI
jgi:hypothetical protein